MVAGNDHNCSPPLAAPGHLGFGVRLLLAFGFVTLVQGLPNFREDRLEVGGLVRLDEVEHHAGIRAKHSSRGCRLRLRCLLAFLRRRLCWCLGCKGPGAEQTDDQSSDERLINDN